MNIKHRVWDDLKECRVGSLKHGLVLRRSESWDYLVVMVVEDGSKVTGNAVNISRAGWSTWSLH